jgi:hypothetical protein
MIDKEIPSEYMSIRQIWLSRIDDCGRAISQRAMQDPTYDRAELNIGERTVVFTIDALYYTLVDFGEALIRTDVDQYKEKIFTPKLKEIWESWEKNQDDEEEEEEESVQFAVLKNKDKTARKRSVRDCWQDHARESMKFFDFIIKTLNKYGMLFEKQPMGFSNVEMRSFE